MINSIKFPCRWTDQYDCLHVGNAEFALGPGPCGKDVTALTLDVSERGQLTIVQKYGDGTSTWFVYQPGDVTGRIQVECGA